MPDNHLPENWSFKLVDSQFDFAQAGLRFRKSRSGPEEDLIQSFLAKLNSKAEPGVQLTIFKEPCLETGFPDLVGVIWHLPTAQKWDRNRFLLQRKDFRVLHRLLSFGRADHKTIQKLFGRHARASFDRLEAASMLYIDHEYISVCPLTTLYAVRHIFAIEVKVSAWRQALRQAFLNRWFATSSHVLLPRMPSNATAISEARSLGVSLWGPEVSKLTLNLPSAPSGPVSYVSWLFNEWAWKVWSLSAPSYVEPEPTFMDQQLFPRT
jgi:hypothetical protein